MMRLFSPYMMLVLACGLLLPNHIAAQSISQNSNFRQVQGGGPEIQYCAKPRAIRGIWKQKSLFEKPAGPLKEEEKAHQHQYIKFRKDGRYLIHKPKNKYRGFRQANRKLNNSVKEGGDIWQYVLGDEGIIYLYKNQIFSHSMYCGKVTKASGVYKKGNIILTPTESEDRQVYITYQPVRRR